MNFDFQEQVSQKSSGELLDIYINSDDYQEDFVNTVFEELQRRNIPLENVERQRKKKHQTKDESMLRGKSGHPMYIALGFISAFLGGFLGIVAGYVYSQSKHKGNPRGDFYVYDEKTRAKGYVMLVVGIIVLLGLLLNSMY